MQRSPPTFVQSLLQVDQSKTRLEKGRARFMYLDNGFPVELPLCPVCGFVYVPEELAVGKVLAVEKALEDK